MKFAEALKDLRISHNLTQAELAKALTRVMDKKISKSAISMYENGNREPDFETLEAIADFFNVDINRLTGRTAYISGETVTKEEKQLLETYRKAKKSDKVAVKALIVAVGKLLKVNERDDE
jgi:transcriptional regulator with XRE-family HTH domain